jgi:hypothetical protein
MSNEKDQSEKCFFKTVQFVLNAPEKKRRRRPRYEIDEIEQRLWLVQYVSESDLAALPEGENAPLGHAVLRAPDEEMARLKFIAWSRWVLFEQVWIESVELLPSFPLKALPVEQTG